MYVKNSYGMVIEAEPNTLGEKYFSGTVVSGGTADYPIGYFSREWRSKDYQPHEPKKPKEVVVSRGFWDGNKLMGEPLIEASELADVFYRDGKLIGVLKCSVG